MESSSSGPVIELFTAYGAYVLVFLLGLVLGRHLGRRRKKFIDDILSAPGESEPDEEPVDEAASLQWRKMIAKVSIQLKNVQRGLLEQTPRIDENGIDLAALPLPLIEHLQDIRGELRETRGALRQYADCELTWRNLDQAISRQIETLRNQAHTIPEETHKHMADLDAKRQPIRADFERVQGKFTGRRRAAAKKLQDTLALLQQLQQGRPLQDDEFDQRLQAMRLDWQVAQISPPTTHH